MIDALGQIDLANPDHYVEAIPFAWFDRLRHDHPVVWHPEQPPNRGFWAVTRHDDLTAVHMDWETFSSETDRTDLGGARRGAAADPELDAGDGPAAAYADAEDLL